LDTARSEDSSAHYSRDRVPTGKDFRAIALALPEAEERETWGHPTFRVRDKMFAAMATDGRSASIKATKRLARELEE
jgi:predicted DNA-binding protein (MmcQ/YjbR family)